MCVFEYLFKKKNQVATTVKDNFYIIDFLRHCSKYSENDLDDKLIELVEVFLQEKS